MSALHLAMGFPLTQVLREQQERSVAALHEQLSVDAFAAAWAAGAAMTLEQAVACAQGADKPPDSSIPDA